MKIACDKCLKIEDSDNANINKNWVKINTNFSTFLLCPICAEGFWVSVDNQLPPIPTNKQEQVIDEKLANDYLCTLTGKTVEDTDFTSTEFVIKFEDGTILKVKSENISVFLKCNFAKGYVSLV